jgi:hypothetical protein
MAQIVDWHGVNKLLLTPKGVDKSIVSNLPVFNNGQISVSCWKLSKEELADVIENDGCVYLAVWFGPSQPPVYVGTEENVRVLVIDHGKVWPKKDKT